MGPEMPTYATPYAGIQSRAPLKRHLAHRYDGAQVLRPRRCDADGRVRGLDMGQRVDAPLHKRRDHVATRGVPLGSWGYGAAREAARGHNGALPLCCAAEGAAGEHGALLEFGPLRLLAARGVAEEYLDRGHGVAEHLGAEVGELLQALDEGLKLDEGAG